MKLKFYIIIFLFIFAWIGLSYYMIQIDLLTPQGYNFCLKKGYDSTSISGSYSEKYGKVKCASCYDDDCIYEEFNVTKKFWILREVEG